MENLAVVKTREIIDIPVEKIRSNPYQPRKVFDMKAIEDLSKSIKMYGVMQPISVRFINGTSYELVAGERRLKASKMAGLNTIPAIVININDKDSAAISLIENIQRENLGFFEEAEGICNLMKDFSYTQEEVARVLGKGQSTIANKIRVLKLSPVVKNMISENDLTERHARALLRIDDENLQMEILNKVVKFGLNVKRTEELIEQALNNREEKEKEIVINRKTDNIRLFKNTIKKAVEQMQILGIETEYSMEKQGDMYEITILVKGE